MRIALALAAATSALALSSPALAQDNAEEEFAELVEGREAGEPTNCINIFNSNRLRVIENVGLAYRQGDTLWVARVTNPRDLTVWDVPIIERYGSQLCRHDVNRTIDRSSGMFSGVLMLEAWVPWTEVEEADG